MPRIVLTADRALFTDFSGLDALGFGLCLPVRLMPSFVEYRILAPRAPLRGGRAAYAPYALAKVEASLLAAGFTRDEVVIVPPEHLDDVIDEDTELVGVHVVDPRGLAPVSWTLRVMTGGGETCTAHEFRRLMERVSRLKRRYHFKVVVGGPGVWQLRGHTGEYGIDVLYEGEAEVDFPLLVKKILDGEETPGIVVGRLANPEEIPPIVTPSRNGHVQITRGCPRGCQFCKPTTFIFRSIPLETILREAELNARAGAPEINFVTEDVLLYGAKGLHLNEDAVKRLFDETMRVVRRYGVSKVTFSHVTLSSALVLKGAVRHISEVNNLSEGDPLFPQVGFESGSPRIVARYFRGKPYPWKPEDWPWIVVEGSKLLNDNYWYPCLTYIVGFPDATPDDYVKTVELIDRLRDEGFKGWVFPLLLIPIGGTRVEGKAGFATLEKLPPEALDAIVAGWEYSIEFSERIYPVLVSKIKNPLARRIVDLLIDKALNAMRAWVRTIRTEPERVATDYPKVNIRNLRGLLSTLLASSLPVRRSRGHRCQAGHVEEEAALA
ncbi:MAG: B12-binding domain-containing radical SAM protein [Desulfurococcales archaeon]|nr:B12-binding domain-containing radical SAM protein [Desulfurococcales archaeon]